MTYVSTQGTQGEEGRSDYDRYVSTEGIQGTEGQWGTEGREYAERKRADAVATRPQSGIKPVIAFSSSDIIQGVMWAEILKKPRARGPYSRK